MIIPYDDLKHREEVLALWREVFGYDTAHNDPELLLDKKLEVQDELLFVAMEERVVGTVMAGYDGHRGWLYSVAVVPPAQGRGIGRSLVDHAEAALAELGCVKINLQMLAGNAKVEGFYARLGYATEPRISMGKVMKGYRRED